jgi:DNA mismatch repair protein MutS2
MHRPSRIRRLRSASGGVRLGELLDEQSAERVGFAWLRSAVAPVSAYGERAFAHVRPYRTGEQHAAVRRARAIDEAARTMPADRVGASLRTIAALPDVGAIVSRAAIGEALEDADFYEVLNFCEGVEPLERIANVATQAVAAALSPGRFENNAFYLADAFDDELRAARSMAADTQAEFEAVRGRERAAATRALGREEISGDEFIVMRADLQGSLPSGVRVLREAATYLLCALEYGDTTLQAAQRSEAASDTVARAEARVRERLSAIVSKHAAALNSAADAVAQLDVTLSAVRYTQRYRCTPAEIVDEPALAFNAGRFLPLEEQLERAGRTFVPIDLALHGPAVITGPNMGGKTVAMQTCGFIALAAAFGLPVPAGQARTALFDRIAWLGVGREERRDGLLSSFAVEIVTLKATMDYGARRLAVFVDEFARTTSPAEGMALTVALLERLHEMGACGLAATHLPGVAKAAQVDRFAVRDFHIRAGQGDERSDGEAIALAQSLGMDEAFVAAAQRALKGMAWNR